MPWPKGKSRKPVNDEPNESDEPEQLEEESVSAQSGMQTSAVEVADIDDAIVEATQPEVAANGRRFFFGAVDVLKFPDGTTYHIQKQHAFVTDQRVIDNLLAYAEKHPHAKIFPE